MTPASDARLDLTIVMANLAVITPSYARDFELCRDLNASVVAYTPQNVTHHIVTARTDLELFSRLRGPRTEVWPVDHLLPKYFVPVPRANFWLNVRRITLPVRGWVMQQLVKLQAAAEIGADVLLLADSDVLLVRPVTLDTFRRNGRLRLYRKDAAIDERLHRHLTWHDTARDLLGVPRAKPPLPDYVSALNVWDRATVLALRDRVQETTGRPWLEAMAARVHVSEFILYGVFVDEVLCGTRVEPTDSMLCHSYWDPYPLSLDAAERFVQAKADDDIAVMISAKSGTPLEVRRAVTADL